jgi:hypothetical protein
VVDELEALVRRDRVLDAGARGSRELRSRLFTEQAEALGRLLEVRPCHRIRIGQDPHRDADHDGIDSRLEERHPDRRAEGGVQKAPPDAERAHHQHRQEQSGRDQQRLELDVVGVDGRDHEQRDDVVDHHHRDHEGAQTLRKSRTDEGEHSERERSVGRHRHAPALCGLLAGVEGEIDQDRDRHPADSGEQRHREPSALPQLAEIELAAGLEPDHEEEERHQAAVDPPAKVLRDLTVPEPDRQVRPPQILVGGRVDVRPRERRDGGQKQHQRAAGLGLEELAQRGLEVSNPGRATRKPCWARGGRHRPSLVRGVALTGSADRGLRPGPALACRTRVRSRHRLYPVRHAGLARRAQSRATPRRHPSWRTWIRARKRPHDRASEFR